MTIKMSQQSMHVIYIYIYTFSFMYNIILIILLGHKITDNDVNIQQNEAYDVIGQFKMKIVRNVSYEEVTTHVNRASDYVNV